MQIRVNNQIHIPQSINKFRKQWRLPDSFSVAYFEPKDWQVGSVEGAGPLLAAIRQEVVNAVDARLTWSTLSHAVDHLVAVFRRELEAANTKIGLQPVEIDFAVAGFADVLQAACYELVRLRQTYQNQPAQIYENFDFAAIYQGWLDDSIRVSATTHKYQFENKQFQIRVIYDAYGRVGLAVEVEDTVHYVADTSLACPAAGYMQELCADVAALICRTVTAVGQP